jgi:hypothetical protein
LSAYKFKLFPDEHWAVSVGVVSFVILSVFDVPLSLESCKSGAEVGAVAAEVLTTNSVIFNVLETFVAVSVTIIVQLE